jgi:hypothetical protein
MKWNKLRIVLLILTFANIVLVLGRSILDPTIGKRTVTLRISASGTLTTMAVGDESALK